MNYLSRARIALLSRYYQRIKRQGYRSQFGGLWVDRNDFQERCREKLASGLISNTDMNLLDFWNDNGFVVIKNALSTKDADMYLGDLTRMYESQKQSKAVVQTSNHEYKLFREVERHAPYLKLVDSYALFQTALTIQFAQKIVDFLRLLFEDSILAFQSLTFEYGSTQALHQDAAYVVLSSPMELVASWVALEDIKPGSGELVYIPGSHRIKETLFSGKYKNWKPNRDGHPQHDKHLIRILEEAHEMGLAPVNFFPEKGDALIWHADLIHGGSPIQDENLTRWSHVTHYCPARVAPAYFPKKNTIHTYQRNSDCLYSSRFYSGHGRSQKVS